jgi:hypothetical protein
MEECGFVSTLHFLLHQSSLTWIDPELANGWDSDATSAESTQWYNVDFGRATQLTGCELAFFVDGGSFALPLSYDILRLENGNWVKIFGFGEQLVANGKFLSTRVDALFLYSDWDHTLWEFASHSRTC